MLKNVLFVINPISGINRKPSKIIRWIEERWSKSNINYDILKTGHRGHGIELARDAVAKGYDMVVAIGGDGTINEIGQGIINSETALGVIPAGSGNGFARNINIPLNQKKAIEILKNPRFKKLDVGKINGHYFFNAAGFGIDAEISAKFNNRKIRGLLPYFFLAIREFFRSKPQAITIRLEKEEEIHRKSIMVSFANLPQFGGNLTIAPSAKGDDGLIDVCIFNPISRWKAIFNSPKLFNGRIEEVSEFEFYKSKEVVIIRPVEGFIHTDGDYFFEDAQLRVQVLPNHLKVAFKN